MTETLTLPNESIDVLNDLPEIEKWDALIVVDVQNDFCPGGSLAVTEGDKVVPVLNRVAQKFHDMDLPVIMSRDWHPVKTKHFKEYGGLWPEHCVQNTHGAEFHPDLVVHPKSEIVSKGKGDEDGYSAFDGTGLLKILKERGVKRVWVGGLATDYCVKNTVLDALKEEFEVIVLTDAMKAVNLNENDGEIAIQEMQRAGARIV